MDKHQFDILAKKLDSITSLLAFNIIKNKPVIEQIETLSKVGLKVSEIALMLDKTENQVYVTQTQLRKKKKESPKNDTEQTQKEDQNDNWYRSTKWIKENF